MATMLINCSAGKEDPERAILPFILGNVAATADQEAIVFLTVEGVRIATHGYADTIEKEGFKPLREIIDSFVANGGSIWACAACTAPRGITEGDMINGAKIMTAANYVEQIAGGAISIW